MAKKAERRALGRGLSALLGDQDRAVGAGRTETGAAAPVDGRPPVTLPIDKIRANPDQPRQMFKPDSIEELAASLRAHGVIQPIIVRPDPGHDGDYQIVAGERRWRAAQKAGLHELPAVIRDFDDKQLLEIAIIENVQRVDLDPVEEARGYAQLIESFDYTQEELAKTIGKSRSHLANTMRLLTLPPQVLTLLRAGKLTAGHARALIGAPDPGQLASEVVAKGLNVRQTEALAKQLPAADRAKHPRRAPEKDADTRAIEGDLTSTLGMKVSIDHLDADGGGEVKIRYKSLDQLDELCRKLSE